jgi:hypothetical protein
MPILNYTSKVPTDKTIGEIHSMLSKRGVRKIMTDYDSEGLPVAITFSMSIADKPVFYALPCNWEGVLLAMEDEKDIPARFCTPDQALRVGWRIIKDWIEAQMAVIDSQQAKLEQVFLPYAVTKTGKTLFEEVESGNAGLLLSE